MSKIAVAIRPSTLSASALMALKNATGSSVSSLRQAVVEGRPVIESLLFTNDHVEQAQRLRDVVRVAAEQRIELELYELAPDESFGSSPPPSTRIDVETLRNILDAASDFR